MKYADVIVDITAEQLDRTFRVRIPETLAGNNPDGNAGGDPLWKRGEVGRVM